MQSCIMQVDTQEILSHTQRSSNTNKIKSGAPSRAMQIHQVVYFTCYHQSTHHTTFKNLNILPDLDASSAYHQCLSQALIRVTDKTSFKTKRR